MGVRRWLIGGVALLAVLAVAQQLVLPALAERQLRGRLAEIGRPERVEVEALPAIKLLFKRADHVDVVMSQASPASARLAELLAETEGIDRLDLRARRLRVGGLVARDASMSKRGPALMGQATVTESDLAAAAPPGLEVRPLVAPDGQLAFDGQASFLGIGIAVRALVATRDGRVLVIPSVPFGAGLTVTAFADPRIYVDAVEARRQGIGFVLTTRARLVGGGG